jgi:hypothetical protein
MQNANLFTPQLPYHHDSRFTMFLFITKVSFSLFFFFLSYLFISYQVPVTLDLMMIQKGHVVA